VCEAAAWPVVGPADMAIGDLLTLNFMAYETGFYYFSPESAFFVATTHFFSLSQYKTLCRTTKYLLASSISATYQLIATLDLKLSQRATSNILAT
jgi:hypothetical protein